ncbi:MAG: hypothetical protein A3C54_08435 [Deltaproteobacteria bacterium RIFCSPHIGHO2_02_FULL_60_17]|nr:MAG: hypothetical protein A3C54_08435 [Deltaproteobacteria bacterium RIFCSPHIGHO2_02_FULL_60_17]
MLKGKVILAVVPARSKSRGIPDKNMRLLGGVSLIGRAGTALSALPFIDARVISTDSPGYAAEGRRYGLDAPFLRPSSLSTDEAGAVETVQHALLESEKHYSKKFDIVLIVEPTSPLRLPEDIERVVHRLIDTGADSVATVSPLPSKFHPSKVLTGKDGRLGFFMEDGHRIRARQQLRDDLYWRNGVCYALTRACLMERHAVITDNTIGDVITRPVVNVDDPIELEWAELLLRGGDSRLAVK